MAADPHVPSDIIENILTRLPAKSLVGFKTVCKSWNATISDPIFIRNHLRRSKSSNSLNLLLLQQRRKRRSCLFTLIKLEGRKLQTWKVLPRPFGDKVLCACDGVFLLSDDSYKTFALWNPLIGGCTKFYYPYRFSHSHEMSFGLCYDPTDNDLKVVVISDRRYMRYSCKSKSWTKRREFPHSNGSIESEGVSIDGAVYWSWKIYDVNHTAVREIIYIDHRNNYEFKFLQKPEDLKSNNYFSLGCLGGCLCLKSFVGTTFRIWIMGRYSGRNYCWKAMMAHEIVVAGSSLPLRCRLIVGMLHNPVCVVEKTKIMFKFPPKGFMVYNRCERRFEKIEGNIISEECDYYHCFPCVDSLQIVSVKSNARPKRKRSIMTVDRRGDEECVACMHGARSIEKYPH